MANSVAAAKSIRIGIFPVMFLMTFCTAVFGQHGKSQKSVLYNFPYKGDTWTGEIVAFDRPNHQVTLQATDKNGQTETFTAKIKLGAKATVKDHPEEKVTALNVGDHIIAYYVAPGQEYVVLDESGKKREAVATENLIFEIEVLPIPKAKN